MVNTSMTHVFKHPKFYRIPRDKTDQAISKPDTREVVDSVRPDPGLKLPGPRPISNANKGLIHRRQAPSSKPQASSTKLSKKEATSLKPQAASVKLQATSFKLHDS